MRRISNLALGVAIVAVGCTAANQLPPDAISKEIGASGGSLINAQGVGVTVPAGAVTKPTLFSIAPVDSIQARPAAVAVGEMFQFGPEGASFTTPVTVTLLFDTSKLPAGRPMSDIVVMRAPLGSTQFEVLPTTVIDAAHVEAKTSHFSVFIPVVQAVSSNDGGGGGGGTAGGAGGGGGTAGGTGGGSGQCNANPQDCYDCYGLYSPVCTGGSWVCQSRGGCGDGGTAGGGGGGVGGGSGGDGGFDGGGGDGGTCSAGCSGPSDGGADCSCMESCNGSTLEILCYGSGTLGCACVRDGVQVGVVTLNYCPGIQDLQAACGFTDGGTDGGFPDGGFDGGFPDGGTDGGVSDGGFPDGGSDGGVSDGGFPDAGNDGGVSDGGVSDGGADAGTPDGGPSDAGFDAGTPDAGANDGG